MLNVRVKLAQRLASMKVPPKRKGNYELPLLSSRFPGRLNESPSEKEGKLWDGSVKVVGTKQASMKVPPKRKGNESSSRIEDS